MNYSLTWELEEISEATQETAVDIAHPPNPSPI